MWKEKRKCSPADFGLEPFLGKAEWVLDIEEKHFCLFLSLIWAFANCATLSLFLFVLLLSIHGLIFGLTFFFFSLLFEQVTLSGKDEPQRKCSFFQEHNFVFLCSSIFVKIQEVWFSIDGLFLRDFFNIVKIVKFCLKNLLSEKPWLKCLKCLSLRCLWYALCSKLPQMFDSFSFLQKQHHSQASIVLFYIKSQWRVTSMIAYLALSYMCSWKRKFCNNHTKEKLFITLISPKDCLEVD